jgi:hypothetical protein
MNEKLLREYISFVLVENEEDVINDVQTQYIDKFDNNDSELQYKLVSRLNAIGYTNLKIISKRRLAVLIDGTERDRIAAMQKIESELVDMGAMWDQKPSGASSIGKIDIDNNSVFVKPASRQGGNSAGLMNEILLVDKINQVIGQADGEPVNIKFVAPAGAMIFEVPGTTKATAAGSDTKGRKKSDINLTAAEGIIVPLSIKKDNGVYWESADTYYGVKSAEIIEKLLNDKEIQMINKGTYYNISPNIAVPATIAEKQAVVFGSDLSDNGAVIKRTFTDGDFSYDLQSHTLTVKCSYIVTDMSHITDSQMDVWFLIRNDKTRKSVPGWPGIRVLAAYEKRINKNVKRIE